MDTYAPAEPTRTSTLPMERAESTERADGMAVASFILGLIGLLAFNIVLGPFALVLGGIALVRGTRRPLRAILGLFLGAADLVVLVVLVTMHHGIIWPFGL
jgi:hypothetical protein